MQNGKKKGKQTYLKKSLKVGQGCGSSGRHLSGKCKGPEFKLQYGQKIVLNVYVFYLNMH
jgi:hypothetical protein